MARFLKKTTRFLLLGGAVGALVYFFDPRSGRGRRSQARDQLMARVRRTTEQAQKKVSYVEGKVEGKVEGVTRTGADEPPADDKALADKIKSEILGGEEYQGHQVLVDAANGVVALRGELSSPEQINDLEAAVRKVPGVREVENYVHLPGTPAPNKQDSLEV